MIGIKIRVMPTCRVGVVGMTIVILRRTICAVCAEVGLEVSKSVCVMLLENKYYIIFMFGLEQTSNIIK